ncbi:MAG: IS21-like element helper ATPase IstB [Myxococcota bacterium]|jgi:DNA replication protein DnaC
MSDTENSLICGILQELCGEMRLPGLLRAYPGLCRQARDGGWPYEDLLRQALMAEHDSRHKSAVDRRLRDAGFGEMKTLDDFDWSVASGISRPKLLELASCDFVKKGQDVVLVGPIGTGKTHLAIALGICAARKRHRVLMRRAADLVRELVEARDDRTLGRLHKQYRKIPLLIVDELGFVPFSGHEGELLFNLLSDRYERAATIVTSNLAFGEWVQVFGNEKLTVALLDRLTHHAHILTTKGSSFRMRTRTTAE